MQVNHLFPLYFSYKNGWDLWLPAGCRTVKDTLLCPNGNDCRCCKTRPPRSDTVNRATLKNGWCRILEDNSWRPSTLLQTCNIDVHMQTFRLWVRNGRTTVLWTLLVLFTVLWRFLQSFSFVEQSAPFHPQQTHVFVCSQRSFSVRPI